MPRLTRKLPKITHHRASGRARVRINGRDHYLGPYGSNEAKAAYNEIINELLSREKFTVGPSSNLTIVELLAGYFSYALEYYRRKDGTLTGETSNIRDACQPVLEHFGATRADDFTPQRLEQIRTKMISSGLARTTINARIDRIRRMFSWGVRKGLVRVTTYQALKAVSGLREGRSAAREAPGICSVPTSRVEATLPFLTAQVAAMVQLQLLSGCRVSEVCGLKPMLIDRTHDIWEFAPERHKGQHHNKSRVICVGPRAQKILLQFWKDDSAAYLFSPKDVAEAREALSEGGRRVAQVADCYSPHSYRQAVVRACARAFPHPTISKIPKTRRTKQQMDELRAWNRQNRWSPLQLRHTRATEVRAAYGLEASQVVLGHSKADVTQIYAERNLDLAREVMRKIG